MQRAYLLAKGRTINYPLVEISNVYFYIVRTIISAINKTLNLVGNWLNYNTTRR
jgi:hypothetical protein